MHRSVLDDAGFIEWANENAIILVPHPNRNHGTVDVAKPAKGEPKKQCALYPGITCEEHQAAFEDCRAPKADDKKDDPKADKKKDPKKDEPKKDAKKKGDASALVKLEVTGFPVSYLVTPDGQFEKASGDRQPGSCKDAITAFQTKFDEHPVPFSKAAEVHKSKDDLEKAMKASQWKQAFAAIVAIDKALDGKLPKALLATVKERVATIDDKVKARVAEIGRMKDAAAAEKATATLKADYAATLACGVAITAFGEATPAASDGGSEKGEPAPAK